MKRLAIPLAIILTLILFIPVLAETPSEMANRVLVTLEKQHPDVLAGCNPTIWIVQQPFLPKLAGMLRAQDSKFNFSDARVACAFGNFKFQHGMEFEFVNRRPPTIYNWVFSYADDMEAYRSLFGIGRAVFRQNDWAVNHYFKYTPEFAIRPE